MMNNVKKFCPVTQRTCDYNLCGWFNDMTGECAVTTLSYKLLAINEAMSAKKTAGKSSKEKTES